MRWATFDDQQLLDVRLCDLQLRITGSVLEDRIARLHRELSARDIKFRPHCWLGEEWFSPDGVPGIAIPFYLAHPRLMRLERKMMMEVEGGSEGWCLRLLRHETGHALDTAFRLSRRARWRRLFGDPRKPYPTSYRPRPTSRRFVQHLNLWYAQAHPAEDFAETFAVWLKPRSRWRRDYEGWHARRKLEYVEELMQSIAGRSPAVRCRRHVAPVSRIRTTLRDHYAQKREYYAIDHGDLHDPELRRLFVDSRRSERGAMTATAFLRRHRRQLCEVVSFWTGQNSYSVHQVLRDMQQRCQELRLRLKHSESETLQQAIAMLATHIMTSMQRSNYRIMV